MKNWGPGIESNLPDGEHHYKSKISYEHPAEQRSDHWHRSPYHRALVGSLQSRGGPQFTRSGDWIFSEPWGSIRYGDCIKLIKFLRDWSISLVQMVFHLNGNQDSILVCLPAAPSPARSQASSRGWCTWTHSSNFLFQKLETLSEGWDLVSHLHPPTESTLSRPISPMPRQGNSNTDKLRLLKAALSRSLLYFFFFC